MATKKNNEQAAVEEVKTETATPEVGEVKTETAAPVDDKVEIFVPRGYANDEPNLLISVNGVNYLLPKGKTSKVPKHIADEFHRSQKAQTKLDERIDQMLEASK